MTCQRCGGRVFRATDEHGNDDTHCVMCGERTQKAVMVDRAFVLADLEHERRMRRWGKAVK